MATGAAPVRIPLGSGSATIDGWVVHASFRVHGIPKPGGSKQPGLVWRKGGVMATRTTATGRQVPIITVRDDCKKSRSWKDTVATFAVQSGASMVPVGVPIVAVLEFVMPRPKGHFRRDGSIYPRFADAMPMVKPDALKLARSTEDALTGVLWRDDAQAVATIPAKRYAARDEPAGCVVRLLIPA